MTFFEFILGVLLWVTVTFWTAVPPMIFSSLTKRERRKWEEYSRRQKIFLGIFFGPFMLTYTLFYIFFQDTGKYWEALFNFLVGLVKKYFSLLK